MAEAIELNSGKPKDDITAIFDQYADSNGKITVNAFANIVEVYRQSLSESTIRKLLQYADQNKDGFITRDELMKLNEKNDVIVVEQTGMKKSDLTYFRRGIGFVGDKVLTNDQDKEKYYQKYTCCPPPFFMILITLAELAVFIYYGTKYGNWLAYSPSMLEGPLIFYPPWRREAWRFFTYMFLHAGMEHLVFNILFQLVFGIPLEMVHGGLRVGAIYIAGVIGGSMASSIFEPSTFLVGASGGVYALITAQLANVILNGDIMKQLVGLLRTLFVVLLLCMDFGYAIYRRFQHASPKSNVSFVAHVAGALAGVSVGLIVLRNFKKSLRDKVAFWIAVGLYIAFMVFGIFWNAFWPHYDDAK